MGDVTEPGCGLMHKRSPHVTVELQFRPPVPSELRPYFWGNGMLAFHDPARFTRKVREFKLDDLPGPHSVDADARMSVRDAGDGFGWVLVIEFTHDQAKSRLSDLGLPHAIDDHEVGLADAARPSVPEGDRHDG